ncbi:hypothetical protein L7F22_062705 [Adiantum nelumboides]|nr:hypothetical protein [Adiantum nelumboides]
MSEDGLQPTKSTFITALNACTHPNLLKGLISLHKLLSKRGHENDLVVGHALINVYGKCGSAKEARKVFHKMREHDIVSWNSMVSAFSQNGHLKKALELIDRMKARNIESDRVTFVHLLSGCTSKKDSEIVEGKKVHNGLIDDGFDSVKEVGNALVSMYSNCGCVEDARKVFDKTQIRTVVSWTAMLDAYASHGYGKEAFDIFRRMQQDGVKPDTLTFVSVLTACSRAETFIKKASFNVGVVEWAALLDSCKNVEDVERAERVAEQVLILDPLCLAAYAVLSDVYRKAGRQDDIARLKTRMEQLGLEKQIV